MSDIACRPGPRIKSGVTLTYGEVLRSRCKLRPRIRFARRQSRFEDTGERLDGRRQFGIENEIAAEDEARMSAPGQLGIEHDLASAATRAADRLGKPRDRRGIAAQSSRNRF